MKTITCLIFDNDLYSIETLQNYAQQIPRLQIKFFFNNPIEGLSFAKKNAPDLIITDVNMPQLSGIDLWTELHQHSWFIFQTSYPDWLSQTMGEKVIDTLYKPFSFERFQSAIQKANKMIYLEQEEQNVKTQFEQLTITEQSVVFHIGTLKESKEIADLSFNSIKTIDRHRENIRKKLGFQRKHELLEFAILATRYSKFLT